MIKTCDICGDSFEPIKRNAETPDLTEMFAHLLFNDQISIHLVDVSRVHIHSYSTCQKCSRKVLEYVESLKGERE